MDTDSGATFFDTANNGATGTIPNPAIGTSMQSYQWRIGGRYFPAQPVQLSTSLGSSVTNGGAEALLELQKALNTVGDYRLSSSLNTKRWALGCTPFTNIPTTANGYGPVAGVSQLNELDYAQAIIGYGVGGTPLYATISKNLGTTLGSAQASATGSSCYASAIDLETSNGIEISGLNAEEQSDIAFIANWSNPQSNFNINVYSYYDAMIVLKENNVLLLIQ